MTQFKNLVFEGGGVRGIAYVGAIEVLSEKGMMGGIKRVGGASAGAITATLLAAGASSDTIKGILSKTDFSQFQDGCFVGGIFRLLNRYGWYKGDAFLEWMHGQLHNLTGDAGITFKRLAQQCGKELHMVGTDLSMQRTVEYSPIHTPDVSVAMAVRTSMSIPLFFAAAFQQRNVLVDGGLTWNYPIDIFDDRKYISQPQNAKLFTVPTHTRYNDDHLYNKETLGFRVDNKDEIAAEKKSWELVPQKVENMPQYIVALTELVRGLANKAHLHQNDWHRTVFIDGLDVPFTNFNLDAATIDRLVKSGRDCAHSYFKWFEDVNNQPLNRA